MDDDKLSIVKGFIDARDEKQAGLYGVFLGVASRFDVKFTRSLFSHEPIDQRLSWQALLSFLREKKTSARDQALSDMESRLENFLASGRLLSSAVKSMNGKSIEQQVNLFCSDDLRLRSVTFVEITPVEEEELLPFEADDQKQGEEKNEAQDTDEGRGVDPEGGVPVDEEEKNEKKLFVACEPILDPVSGVAISDLEVGVNIVCKLPEDSIYYKLFVSRFPDFEGSVTGEITGIRINELGTAIVGVSLADGISGVLKLSGKVRIRLANKNKEEFLKNREDAWGPWNGEDAFPLGFAFGSTVVFLLLCLIGALLYFLS